MRCSASSSWIGTLVAEGGLVHLTCVVGTGEAVRATQPGHVEHQDALAYLKFTVVAVYGGGAVEGRPARAFRRVADPCAVRRPAERGATRRTGTPARRRARNHGVSFHAEPTPIRSPNPSDALYAA